MRRALLAIALCLLLGLLTSIALAWVAAIELHGTIGSGTNGRIGIGTEWVGRVETDVFSRIVTVRRVGDGRPPPRWTDPDAQPQLDLPAPFQALVEPPYSDNYTKARGLVTGLPFPCLFYSRRLDGPYYLIEDWDYTNRGVLRGYNPFENIADAQGHAMLLPLRPYWPGLLASVSVLAVSWFVLPFIGYTFRILRAVWRRRKRRCAFCAHQLHDDADLCTECGRARRARQPLVTRRVMVSLAGFAFLLSIALIGFAITFAAHDPVPPILRASYEGDAERVRQVLADGADPETIQEVLVGDAHFDMTFSVSPLLAAATSGDLATVRAVLDTGADPNIALNGFPPLSVAADASHFEICDLLIDRGADPNLEIGRSMSPLDLPVISGNLEAVRYLLDRSTSLSNADTAIISAFAKRNNPMIDLLIEHAVDVDVVMRIAVWFGDRARFEQLRACGADPGRRSDEGDTLLFNGRPEMFDAIIYEEILAAGVDVNTQNATGETALSDAGQKWNPRLVLLLLMHGADPNLQDENGHQALRLTLDSVSDAADDVTLCALFLLGFHADPTQIDDDALQRLPEHLRDAIEAAQLSWQQFDARQQRN